MSDETFTIRLMTKDDLSAVATLAAKLVRMHHELDPRRFFDLPNAEAGYARYFEGELANDGVVLIVGQRSLGEGSGTIVGYAYGRLEPRSYNELLDPHGRLHDVYVEESARGSGLGEGLVNEVVSRLTAKGAPRVLAHTAIQNEAAQHVFKKLGFRTTMIEMTREAEPPV